MSKLDDLSRRERQIMDVIYKRRKATAADVHKALPDAPTYSAVRALLRVLEEKKHLRHRREGARYVFEPTLSRSTARRDAISRLVRTFFDGSAKKAASAFLESRRLTEEDLAELRDGIERRILSSRRNDEAVLRPEMQFLACELPAGHPQRPPSSAAPVELRLDEAVLRPQMRSSNEPVDEELRLEPFRRELDERLVRELQERLVRVLQERLLHELEIHMRYESLAFGRPFPVHRVFAGLARALLDATRRLDEQGPAADAGVDALVPTTSGSSPNPPGLAPSRPDPGGLSSTTSRPSGW